jgi:hypothetical protein
MVRRYGRLDGMSPYCRHGVNVSMAPVPAHAEPMPGFMPFLCGCGTIRLEI